MAALPICAICKSKSPQSLVICRSSASSISSMASTILCRAWFWAGAAAIRRAFAFDSFLSVRPAIVPLGDSMKNPSSSNCRIRHGPAVCADVVADDSSLFAIENKERNKGISESARSRGLPVDQVRFDVLDQFVQLLVVLRAETGIPAVRDEVVRERIQRLQCRPRNSIGGRFGSSNNGMEISFVASFM